MSGTSGELRLFVTLKVRPEQFAIYLKAMQEEAAGARGEAGNLGFDLFEDADHAHTLYLLEHWASRTALEQDHARQPYYIHVRGLEAEALTGEVEERQLLEVEPQQVRQSGDAKSVAGAHTQVTVLKSTDDDALADLDRAFGEAATALRNAGSNRTFSLFRDRGNAHERLLLEAWDDAASREAAGRRSRLRPYPGVRAMGGEGKDLPDRALKRPDPVGNRGVTIRFDVADGVGCRHGFARTGGGR